MDEYERLETLRKRLKDQERWDGLSNEELRDRRYKVERAIRDLLIAEPLEAATAPASSASSPSTTGPSAKPMPSPGANPDSKLPLSTGADTSESFRSAQNGMAGELLEEVAGRYLQETSASWRRFYFSIQLLMSESPTRSGESPVGVSGDASHEHHWVQPAYRFCEGCLIPEPPQSPHTDQDADV